MNKGEFIAAVAAKLDAPKTQVACCYDAFIATLIEGIKEGKVDLAGFGKFEVKDVAARTGVNPATGEKIAIAASKKIAFKAAKALKDQI